MNDFAEGYAIGRDTSGSNNGGWGNGSDFLWVIVLLALFGRNGFGGFGGGFGGGNGCCHSACATQADLANGFAQNTLQRGIDDILLQNTNNLNFINQGFAGLNTAIVTNGYDTRNAVTNGFAGVNNAICNLGYNQATLINGLSRELSECCCKTNRSIDQINYNMANNTCAITNAINNSSRDIIDNQNANYRALHEEIIANKIEAKNERIAEQQAQIQALQLKASQEAQNNYLVRTLTEKLGTPCPIPAYTVPNPNCCYNQCGCSGL